MLIKNLTLTELRFYQRLPRFTSDRHLINLMKQMKIKLYTKCHLILFVRSEKPCDIYWGTQEILTQPETLFNTQSFFPSTATCCICCTTFQNRLVTEHRISEITPPVLDKKSFGVFAFCQLFYLSKFDAHYYVIYIRHSEVITMLAGLYKVNFKNIAMELCYPPLPFSEIFIVARTFVRYSQIKTRKTYCCRYR